MDIDGIPIYILDNPKIGITCTSASGDWYTQGLPSTSKYEVKDDPTYVKDPIYSNIMTAWLQ